MPYGTIAADRITGTNGNSISPESSVFRNRIINGDMTIDQRNAGAAVTTDNTYSVDRFLFRETTDGTASIQRSSTAPTGFVNSILFTVTGTDSSLSTNQYAAIQQRIEGFNVADLGFGTANAKTVTLSFWVRSSVTGTFGGSLSNSAADRSYPFSYTINSADTWEYETITIPGDTSGTWLTTNGIGIQLNLTMAAASNLLGPANTWASAFYIGTTGNTNLHATNGATFYITGVQLEVGSTATSYEYLSYGTELALCQRYYESGSANPSCFADSFGNAVWEGFYKVDKRATGTLTYDDANGNTGKIARWFTGSYSSNVTPSGLSANGTKSFSGNITGLSAGTLVKVGFSWYQNSEL